MVVGVKKKIKKNHKQQEENGREKKGINRQSFSNLKQILTFPTNFRGHSWKPENLSSKSAIKKRLR